VNSIILILTAAVALALCTVCFVVLRTLKPLCYAYNTILELERTLLKEFPRNRKDDGINKEKISRDKTSGMILLFTTLAGFAAPYVMLILAIVSDIDVYYFLLEFEFLPNPIYRELRIILLAILIRIILLSPGFFEGTRSTACLTSFAIVAVNSIREIVDVLESKNLKVSRFQQVYIRITLLYQMAEPLVYSVVYCLLTFLFWLVVGSSWITVCGFGKVPPSLFIMSCVVTIVVLTSYTFILPMYTKIPIRLVKILRKHKKQAYKEFIQLKTRQRKIYHFKAKALAPIRVKYGPFFSLDETFVVEDLFLITQRIFDAILIVDFR